MKRTFFFIFFLFLFGCEKEEELAFPLVQTGAVTDITPEGAMFNGRVLRKGENEILEYGFVWAAEGISILSDGQKISVREAAPDGTISLFISTTLAPNVKYQVKAYVKDKNHVTYGATTSFLSLGSGGPTLTDFYPKAGDILDTLTITGKNFSSNKSDNRVLFDDKFSQIIYASRDTLVVQVPELLGKEFTSLSVSVVNNKAIFEEKFQLHAAEITDFYPQPADLRDTITIVGKNLCWVPRSSNVPMPYVKIGTRKASFIPVSCDTLLVVVPISRNQETAELQLTNHNGITTTAENLLKIKAPEITAFYPEYGDLNGRITIVGKNLSRSTDPKINPYVLVGGIKAEALNFSADTVIIRVPGTLNNETAVLSVEYNGFTTSAEKTFKLNTPKVSSFYPEYGNLKDTLTIIGKNLTTLSNPSKNTVVKIGTVLAPILRVTPDTVIVTVPGGLSEETAALQLRNHNGLATTTEKSFKLNAPLIIGFSPKEGGFDAILTITGAFAEHPASLEAFIGGQKVTIQESSDTWLKISLPPDLTERTNTVEVKMNNFTRVAPEKFTVAPLILHDFSPKILETGQEITIKGENFHPMADKNKIVIGYAEATVIQASTTELKVKVPLQESVTYPYPSRNAYLSVEVLNDKKVFNERIFIDDPWFRITDFPGASPGNTYLRYKSFVINDIVYIGLISTRQLWSYNLQNKEWDLQAGFPGYNIPDAGFVANDKIYCGTASEWYEYNPGTNAWASKKNITDENSTVSIGFSFQNKGYVALKKLSEPFSKIWKYDNVQDSWQQAIDFPEVQGGSYYTEFALTNDSELFLGLRQGNDALQSKMMIYVFSFATASWRQIADYPANGGTSSPLKFILNNQLYLKTHFASNFWKYDGGTNSWIQEPTAYLPSNMEGGISFSTQQKVYIGLGSKKAIWEYDPNR